MKSLAMILRSADHGGRPRGGSLPVRCESAGQAENVSPNPWVIPRRTSVTGMRIKLGLDEGLLKTDLINVYEQRAATDNCCGAWRKLVPAWERNPLAGQGNSSRRVHHSG